MVRFWSGLYSRDSRSSAMAFVSVIWNDDGDDSGEVGVVEERTGAEPSGVRAVSDAGEKIGSRVCSCSV